MQVGKPKVILRKDKDGHTMEPMEALTIDVPQDFMGVVMEDLGTRKAELVNMHEMAGYMRGWSLRFPPEGSSGSVTSSLPIPKATAS